MPARRVPRRSTAPIARVPADAIAATRRFNRFYTARLRLLDRSHLESPYSLTAVRLLYELAHRERPTARTLAAVTGIDTGQLSRLLDARASAQVADALGPVAPSDREELLECLAGVQVLLSPPGQRAADAVVELRDARPGDMGWVVERHGAVYSAEYGWDAAFECLVAGIIGAFRGHVAGARERAWIATVDGRRAGCIFVMRKSDDVAKLRLLLVEPWARGLGLGNTLVRACLDGAAALGYRRMTLWTNTVLDAARHIYEREGFVLVDEAAHDRFGRGLIGQTWERDLEAPAPRARSRVSRAAARS